MARNCGCAGSSCSCLIEAGAGINVSGIGTAADPYVITAVLGQLSQAISFQDSTSIDFTVTGFGTIVDPMTVTAVVKPAPWPVYPTGGRPSAVAAGAGAFYYDSTLKKPAWSDGAVWKDAAGTTV